jgi:hypothetical protein
MEDSDMMMSTVVIQPTISLVAGILILIFPHVLNYIIAIYQILIGLAGLLPHLTS